MTDISNISRPIYWVPVCPMINNAEYDKCWDAWFKECRVFCNKTSECSTTDCNNMQSWKNFIQRPDHCDTLTRNESRYCWGDW